MIKLYPQPEALSLLPASVVHIRLSILTDMQPAVEEDLLMSDSLVF